MNNHKIDITAIKKLIYTQKIMMSNFGKHEPTKKIGST